MTACRDYTCGQYRAAPFAEGLDCPLCYAAAYRPGVAAALGRAVVGPEPCRCKHPCSGCRESLAGSRPDLPLTGPPVGRRHLVYHLLPVSGNGVWQESVNRLRLRWSLFTGRKIIAVMTGDAIRTQDGGRAAGLDPPAVVRRHLPPDAEVVELPNDPGRWELVSWPHLWGRVLDGAGELDAVLYAHAKGVTRTARVGLERYGYTTQLWAKLLADLCLDYWPEVEAEFRRGHPIVGPFVKTGHLFGGPAQASEWHYSGNWWWVLARNFRARWPLVPVPVDRWGTEAWAGIAYRLDEAGRVGPDVGHADLYDVGQWNDLVIPAAARWAADHVPTAPGPVVNSTPASGPVRLSVIVPTTGRDTLGRTLDSLRPQLLPGEELIVERDATGDWGATPRTKGMRQATGTHLLFQDDDDVTPPGALAQIRTALAEHPGRPHLFRMRRGLPFSDTIPKVRDVRVGNVSTQMFVPPNDPAKLGVWGPRYEGDFDFIASTLAHYPDGPVWRDEVISVWRPDPPASDPTAVGVVIGAYLWPALIDLQIRLIRETCGPVPVLVSDDCSPGFPDGDRYARLQAVCGRHADVTLWPNAARIGHTGGDVAAVWKGLIWGRARGLAVVAKLSQRLCLTAGRWLQTGAAGLIASGLPLAARRCTGPVAYPLRTEGLVLAVDRCHRPDVLARLTPREYHAGRPDGTTAELLVSNTLRDQLGGLYWPWAILPEDRAQRAPGVIWHHADVVDTYRDLAARHGVILDADFHAGGWDAELVAGTYRHG